MIPARFARQQGWKVGTKLKAVDGTVITITAIGIEKVLAVLEGTDHEACWDLTIRTWDKIHDPLDS